MPNMGDKQNERVAYTAPRWVWMAIIIYLKRMHKPVAEDCLRLLEPVTDEPDPLPTPYPVCNACESVDVKSEAYAVWDQNEHDWVVCATFDNGHICENCGSKTTLRWITP